MALDQDVIELARGENFAAVTTLLPGGHPQTQVVWVDADENNILINTEKHRQKYANVIRDPRITVLIWDLVDPYRYVEIRGIVVDIVGGKDARDHINQCAQRYRGRAYANPIQSERVILRISADRVVSRL